MRFLERFQRAAVLALPALLTSAPALAGVIVVDDDGGPGVDFTDIPPAIEFAHVGDVILVKTGSYNAFNLNKGVAILGEGTVQVATFWDESSRVSFLPAGRVAILRGLSFSGLRIANCAGTVVLEDVQTPGPSFPGLEIQSSSDVRAVRVTATRSLLLGSASRLELVRSTVSGLPGQSSQYGNAGAGGTALVATGGSTSRMHLVLTSLGGGSGGNYTGPCFLATGDGGNGGDGLYDAIGFLQASGVGSLTHISGGAPGSGCDGPAEPGKAVVAQGLFRYSGVSFNGTVTGNVQYVDPPDPFLADLSGEPPTPGATILFTVFGAPGDQVTLYLGRSPVVEAVPSGLIEKLTSEDRSIPLGTISDAGYIGWAFKLPASLPKGFCFFTQARILRNGITDLRTNSIPIVVR